MVLSNCNEDLTLTANTNTYKSIFSSLTFPKLEDQITLNALLDIEVVPKRALYYLDKRNTGLLKVLHGSGIFNVKCNDTNIISFDFNRTEGTITITPLNKGFVRIIVEDLKLESSIPSYCDIIVMDVAKLKLTSNSNLIQINDATIFELTILDQNNEIFPQDQYKYMSISLVLDTDSEYLKNSALKITHLTNKEKYLFNVQGFISGYYKVVAILETNKINNNLDLYSNLVDLHVFSELKIYPTELLLAPGCSSTIEVIDGPSEKSKALNNIILEVNTPNNIVSFKNLESNLFEVFGLILGQSDIIFNLKQKDTNKIIGKSSIKVQVGLVNDIEILGMVDRILYIGSIVRLIGISKTKQKIIINLIFFLVKLNKMPLSHCICKFDYLWKSKDENILSIASIVPETVIFKKNFNLILIYI